MVLLELTISYIKLVLIFSLLGAFCMHLMFKLMCGTCSYYYDRGLRYYDVTSENKDTNNMAHMFKPVLKRAWRYYK